MQQIDTQLLTHDTEIALTKDARAQLVNLIGNQTASVNNLSITPESVSFELLISGKVKSVTLDLPKNQSRESYFYPQANLSLNRNEQLVISPKSFIAITQLATVDLFALLKTALKKDANTAVIHQSTQKLTLNSEIKLQGNQPEIEIGQKQLKVLLPKQLAPLLSPKQQVVIDITPSTQRINLAIKLDKHAKPVVEIPLNAKKVLSLINQQTHPVNVKQSTQSITLKYQAKELVLATKPIKAKHPWHHATLRTLGDNVQVKVAPNTLTLNHQLPNKAQKTFDNSINTVRMTPQLPERIVQLKPIKSFTLAPQLLLTKEGVANIRAQLSELFSAPKMILTSNGDKKPFSFTQLFQTSQQRSVLDNEPQSLKKNQQAIASQKSNSVSIQSIYQRPKVKHEHAMVIEQSTLKNSDSTVSSNKVTPLQALSNITKHFDSLPTELKEMVRTSFDKIMHIQRTTPNNTMHQLSGQLQIPYKANNAIDSLSGQTNQLAITLSALQTSQSNELPTNLQPKLDNILAILLGGVKKVTNTKNAFMATSTNQIQQLFKDVSTLQQSLLPSISQSSSSSETSQPYPTINFNFPFKDQHELRQVNIAISKESHKNKQGNTVDAWLINLNFNVFNEPLAIEAQLINKHTQLTLYACDQGILNNAHKHLHQLKIKLANHGLVVTDIKLEHNVIKANANNQHAIINIKI